MKYGAQVGVTALPSPLVMELQEPNMTVNGSIVLTVVIVKGDADVLGGGIKMREARGVKRGEERRRGQRVEVKEIKRV